MKTRIGQEEASAIDKGGNGLQAVSQSGQAAQDHDTEETDGNCYSQLRLSLPSGPLGDLKRQKRNRGT